MTRTVSSPMATRAAAAVNQPAILVRIDWASSSSYLCSHSTVSWAGLTWSGAGIAVDSFDADGKPGRLTLRDPDAAFRTLILSDGLRDRRVRIWQADVDALADADPVALFDGYGDGAQWARGTLAIELDWTTNARQFTPRERICHLSGVNFAAAPGVVVEWGGRKFRIPRRGAGNA